MIQYLSNCTWTYVVCVIVSLFFLYKFICKFYSLEEKYGYPGPPTVPILGNMLNVAKRGFHVADVENKKKYGNIYPEYNGLIGFMVISDETLLKQILIKEAKNFIDRPTFPTTSQKMKKNLLRLKGKDWERVRSLVTPTFTSGKLKKMWPLIMPSIKCLDNAFAEHVNLNANVKDLFQSLTMDVIAKTMFGMELNVFETSSHPFVKHANRLFHFSGAFLIGFLINLFPFMKRVIDYVSPYGIVAPVSLKFFEKTLIQTIKIRRESKEEYHDFLALMLKAHEELKLQENIMPDSKPMQNVKGLSEDEIIAQAITFLLAGFETTASALTFTSYYLTKNPEVQEEVYRQIIDVVGEEEDITLDDLAKMNLLDQCLQETLRICPPAVRVSRLCTNTTTLMSSTGRVLRFDKGQVIMVPIFAIHHDSEIWQDPEEFDIHRFDPEVKQSRSQLTYMPFGMGPRNCVGMRFAQMEAKLALAHILRKYKLEVTKDTPTRLQFAPAQGLSKLMKPIIVKVVDRRSS